MPYRVIALRADHSANMALISLSRQIARSLIRESAAPRKP